MVLIFSLFVSICVGQINEPKKDIRERIEEGRNLIRTDKDGSYQVLYGLKKEIQQTDSDTLLGLIYKNIGVWHDQVGNSDSAHHYYDEALLVYQTNEIEGDLYSDILLNKGVAYYLLGDYDNALNNYYKAYLGYKETDNKKRVSSVLNNLGIIHRLNKDYDASEKAYTESLDIKLLIGDSLGAARNYENLALLNGVQSNLDIALDYVSEARKMYEGLGLSANARLLDNLLGQIYFQSGDYKNAIFHLDRMLKSDLKQYLNRRELVADVAALADSYRALGNLEKAKEVTLSYKEEWENGGRKSEQSEFYEHLYYIYKAEGKNSKAFEFLEKHIELYKELVNSDRIESEEEMMAKFDLLDKENKIQEQNLDLLKSQNIRSYLILALAFAAILIGLLYILYSFRKKANKKLSEKNSFIQKSLEEKEILLKEIHHRVKNNLQIVTSIINLQSKQYKDAESKAVLQGSKNRIKSMSLIHEFLYQEDQLTGIKVQDYVKKLSSHLLSAYGYEVYSIEYDIKPKHLILDVDTMIPLGLIINELITNSLKYGFSQNQDQPIIITMETKGEEKLILKVSDSGEGFIMKEDNRKVNNSFGFKLIKSLLRKLDGSIEVDQNPTTVTVSINRFKVWSHG